MAPRFIVITGGTHGIGRACVEILVAEGAQVLFTGRDQAAGMEIQQLNPGSIYKYCDVASEVDCKAVADLAMELGNGFIHGLVNNAGISKRMAFHETSRSDWEMVMSINATSVYMMTRLCLSGLLAAKGSVVTTSSVAGLVGQRGLALYTASKAALIGLTQALALEYGDSVRFNAICPGQIDTRMMQAVTADSARLANIVASIPAARLGGPHEVADVVSWLLSSKSSFINGAIIPVDGGETAGIFE
jgi:NAD(P)-dependent dehydrogenase (short-subunit alcohol dehydrogenase family)